MSAQGIDPQLDARLAAIERALQIGRRKQSELRRGTPQASARLSRHLHAEITKLARQRRVTFAAIIRAALEWWSVEGYPLPPPAPTQNTPPETQKTSKNQITPNPLHQAHETRVALLGASLPLPQPQKPALPLHEIDKSRAIAKNNIAAKAKTAKGAVPTDRR